MTPPKFEDFSQLYRAAYAEADQERKLMLLREVRKAIDERTQESQDEISEAVKAA
jgi:hypothetical protein